MGDSAHDTFPSGFRGYDREAVDSAIAELNAAIQIAEARRGEAETRVEKLMEEVSELAKGDARIDTDRYQEILRAAEEQADRLSASAVSQAERLLEDVKANTAREIAHAQQDADRIIREALYQAEQIRISAETAETASEQAQQERIRQAQAQVELAERESEVIRSEAERLAGLVRSQARDEAEHMRAEAQELLADAQRRASEIDGEIEQKHERAQQEFLRLHNEAVAHAQRVTDDANEAVRSALAHAEHVTEQAQLVSDVSASEAAYRLAEAHTRAAETLDAARAQASALVETVNGHSKTFIREAEDRLRMLRLQERELSAVVAEVSLLMGVNVESAASLDELVAELADESGETESGSDR